MNLDERLSTWGTEVEGSGVFDRVQQLHRRRRTQRIVRRSIAGLTMVAASAIGVLVVTRDDGATRRVKLVEDSPSISTPPPPQTALLPLSPEEEAKVQTVVEQFLSPTSTPDIREGLLENGPALRPSLDALANLPGGLPYGPWSEPTVTIFGAVGDTAVVDASLSFIGDQGSATSPAGVTDANLQRIEVIRSNNQWKIASNSWCQILRGIPAAEIVGCDAKYQTRVRLVEGTAGFSALDEQSGTKLPPQILGRLSDSSVDINGSTVMIPGLPGYFTTTQERNGVIATDTGVDLVHYGFDGNELARIPISESDWTPLYVDTNVEPPALWALSLSGAQTGSQTYEAVRVSSDLQSVTARVPLRMFASERIPAEFIPIGDTVSYGEVSTPNGPDAPVMDLVTHNLSGEEVERVRLLDRVSNLPVEGSLRLEQAGDSSTGGRVVATYGNRLWIVDPATGGVLEHVGEDTQNLIQTVYADGLYALSLNGAGVDPGTSIERIDLATGIASEIMKLPGTSNCTSIAAPQSTRRHLLLFCGAPPFREDVSGTYPSTGGSGTFSIHASNTSFLYDIDIASKRIVQTLVFSGGYATPLEVQSDPNNVMFATNFTLMSVALPKA